jgi:Holliday junction resolvase RusA-like endonuclease
VLKLARAVEDALTGVVWRDDAEIVAEGLAKLYGTPERVEISITEV